jgi:hypothetical protein
MTITLDFLGEAVRQMQADIRNLRFEVGALRAERGETIRLVSDLIQTSETRMLDRIAAGEAHFDVRLDHIERDMAEMRDRMDRLERRLEVGLADLRAEMNPKFDAILARLGPR